jgi:hypothetical protein
MPTRSARFAKCTRNGLFGGYDAAARSKELFPAKNRLRFLHAGRGTGRVIRGFAAE